MRKMSDTEYGHYRKQVDRIVGGSVQGFATDPDGFPIILVERHGTTYGIVVARDPEFNGRGHFEVDEVNVKT